MKANLVVVHDPFHPLRHREISKVDISSVRESVPQIQSPHVVSHNGQWLLREDWDDPVSEGDVIVIVVLPQ